MKIITEDRLFSIWCTEHSTSPSQAEGINRDILAECQGVKLLTMVHRPHVYLGIDDDGLPQWGETFTWFFKGHNGEREMLSTWCQWASDRNTGE